ncbi:MAG: BamA/TamA family outer membrane protein [Saprospiraceae bacterium]|nr:BamA/TamA family outer membrane protein [Saprospiraceae bacterium]
MIKALFFQWMIVCIIVVRFIQPVKAQDTLVFNKPSIAAYPILYYTPETRWGFGGAGIFTFRFKGETAQSAPSQIQAALTYTLNKQVLAYVPFQLFWKDEEWIARGELGYFRYVYDFFGVGNGIDREYIERYSVNYPRVRINLLKRVLPNFYGGLRYWFDDYRIVQVEEDKLLSSGEVFGSEGGVVSGMGLVAQYDSRDNIFYPSKGIFLEAASFWNSQQLGSTFDFNRYTFDLSFYMPLSKNQQHILALNYFTGAMYGNAPFNQLMFLGGPKKGRGYIDGRFRDDHLALVQAEYRFPLFWRFSGVTFATLGGIATAMLMLIPSNFAGQQVVDCVL